MKKLISIGLATMLCGVGFSATAQTGVHKSVPTKDAMAKQGGMSSDMKTMDANGDGMISKTEYNKYHAYMWNNMKRDKAGMVTMDDMFEANKQRN